MSQVKVSVITGYYNRADVLEYTIASILNQSYKNLELIVFNDRSTDNTDAELLRIEEKYNDPRLIVINHEENIGFTKGMINAISKAKGEYICVQGSGDYSFPERIKMQVAALDAMPLVGVVGSYYENFIDGSQTARLRAKIADDCTFSELVKSNIFSHGEVMMRRTCYEEAGGYREQFRNCQDYDLWLRMIKICQFYTVKELLYRRHIRFDGVSYNPKSFLRQTRYFFLCKDLAHSDSVSGLKLLNKIRPETIEELIPLREKRVQKRIIIAALRSAVFEGGEESLVLIRDGIKSKTLSVLLTISIKIFRSKVFSPFRLLVNNILGIK